MKLQFRIIPPFTTNYNLTHNSVPINTLARTASQNSVPTMYTPHIPDSLKDAYHVPELVPRTEANHELCDYDLDPVSFLLYCH
jgi:hypothetical protein